MLYCASHSRYVHVSLFAIKILRAILVVLLYIYSWNRDRWNASHYWFRVSICCSTFFLQSVPLCLYANQSGLNMLETTADNLFSLTVDKIISGPDNLSLDSLLQTVMQQVLHMEMKILSAPFFRLSFCSNIKILSKWRKRVMMGSNKESFHDFPVKKISIWPVNYSNFAGVCYFIIGILYIGDEPACFVQTRCDVEGAGPGWLCSLPSIGIDELVFYLSKFLPYFLLSVSLGSIAQGKFNYYCLFF